MSYKQTHSDPNSGSAADVRWNPLLRFSFPQKLGNAICCITTKVANTRSSRWILCHLYIMRGNLHHVSDSCDGNSFIIPNLSDSPNHGDPRYPKRQDLDTTTRFTILKKKSMDFIVTS